MGKNKPAIFLNDVSGLTSPSKFHHMISSLVEPPELINAIENPDQYYNILNFVIDYLGDYCNSISCNDALNLISKINYRFLYQQQSRIDDIQIKKVEIIRKVLDRSLTIGSRKPCSNDGIVFILNAIGNDVETEMTLPYLQAIAESSDFPKKTVVVLNKQEMHSLPEWSKNLEFISLHSIQTQKKIELLREKKFRLAFYANDITCKITEQSLIATASIAPLQITSSASCISVHDRSVQGFIIGESYKEFLSNEAYSESKIEVPGCGNFINEAVITYGDALRRARSATKSNRNFSLISGANLYKLNSRLLDCWVRLLKQNSNYTLTLAPFNRSISSDHKQRLSHHLIHRFVSEGIDSSRIILLDNVGSRRKFMEILCEHDCFVDSFPFSSGNGAADAAVVGLPVVSMRGFNFRGNLAAAVMVDVCSELVTTISSEEDYINAVGLIADSYKRKPQIPSERFSRNFTNNQEVRQQIVAKLLSFYEDFDYE
jgi:hypothetical protein